MDFDQLGPYKIGPRLGKGGMGSVYRGLDVGTQQAAAIKALAPQLATSEGFRERFEAEIESLKTLEHDGIVRLYGYGEEAGTLFYAMELVEGRSLEEELKAARRFSWREVVDIAIQVCKALKHAHDHGIVHRDIKPANILLDQNEKVKLADFGIARLFGGTQLTIAGGVLGTADYMSPEQAEGRPVTDRCDQYSLGCVMYALLAGRPPFQASNLPEMLQLQRFAEPEPVRRYATRAPEQLEHCISQLLKKDPRDRFPNTMVLARHLEAMRRALSRPFDPANPMDDDRPKKASDQDSPNESEPIPLELAATKSDNTNNEPEDSDAELDAGTPDGLMPLPTSMRNAATVDSLAVEPVRPTFEDSKTADHFTTVDSDVGQVSQVLTPSVITASLGLLGMLAALAYAVYQFSQPYDADALYGIIQADAPNLSIADLRAHSSHIDHFIARFPDDPRATKIREYQNELEVDRQERRFDTLVRGRGDDEGLLTAERLYLSALRRVDHDPTAAVTELRNLLALFAGSETETLTAKQRTRFEACMELARRQLDSLEQDLVTQTTADIATLNDRLNTAEKLHSTDQQQAVAICHAVVELYDDKTWAAELVGRAQDLLASWEVEE